MMQNAHAPGMLSVGQLYVRLRGRAAVRCAKLHHHNHKRCIFHCGYRSRIAGDRSRGLSDQLPQ